MDINWYGQETEEQQNFKTDMISHVYAFAISQNNRSSNKWTRAKGNGVSHWKLEMSMLSLCI